MYLKKNGKILLARYTLEDIPLLIQESVWRLRESSRDSTIKNWPILQYGHVFDRSNPEAFSKREIRFLNKKRYKTHVLKDKISKHSKKLTAKRFKALIRLCEYLYPSGNFLVLSLLTLSK
jgi:hypothetical protein